MRKMNGKNVPIGANKPSSGTGAIEFYDVGKRSKVSIARSKVSSVKTKNGKYKLTATAPGPNKAGKSYQLHRFSSNPA